MNGWAKALFLVASILFLAGAVWLFHLLLTSPRDWTAILFVFAAWACVSGFVLVFGLLVRLSRPRDMTKM